ncbi:putative reverse transcriptase domain-containing protein [Tanacetum coccineum]
MGNNPPIVSKFIKSILHLQKTTYYRNEIITFYQKPNETFNEAWERFKGLLRQCPHHGFSELHQLDTFYNSLNSNDQDALDSAAGGNFLDKMPQEGLAIIESKSKVRYSRSRANDSRVSTDAPLSNSSPSNNSFDMQQIAASLEDKMTIKMNQMMNEMKALVVTTPAPVKAVEEIVMENPNHLNEPNKVIPEVNPVVPEPNQVVNIHDPNEMVDILDDIDLVDYDEEDHEEDPEEDPEENPKEEPEEDVDIEIEDDAKLIFPYEVEGDKTPLPGDVSSDSVSSDSESEDKEVDVALEATIRTITQKPYVIHDFPRCLFEVGELSSARDSSHADGLAPWALRCDLEASRAQARVMEAELGTCQTEIALFKSKNKIGEKERELLNHDLENKRLAETETMLAWARMERDIVERMLHESRVWNKMFYLDMVHIGAVPKPPSDDEDTERPRKKFKNSTSDHAAKSNV